MGYWRSCACPALLKMPRLEFCPAVRPEFSAAGGIETVHILAKTRLDARHIRDVGAAETERVAHTGGSLLRCSLRRSRDETQAEHRDAGEYRAGRR